MIDLPTDAAPIQLVEGDCLATMRALPDSCVDLVLTDPPYFKVKGEWWDRQWDTPTEFLAWMGQLCDEWKRVLKPNGSLYVFASPQMAWHVEGVVRERFNVLQRVTWVKEEGWAKRQCKEEQRMFFPASETIIFAEQRGADSVADTEVGYSSKCEEAKRSVIGVYLREEMQRAGVTNRQIAALFPSATGGLTGCVSNWLLGNNMPIAEQYATIRAFLNNTGGDYLRREYEDLRREYEDLRRPFFASEQRPYTDVWNFPTVNTYAGKHPCEKPLAMMEHIIETSSRPGALVLDCFAGSGVVGEAARNYGRRALLCEVEPKWCNAVRRRLSQGDLFTEAA